MNVMFLVACELFGRGYPKGKSFVQMKALRSVAFRNLLKQGKVAIIERSSSEQSVQSMKDAFAAHHAHRADITAKPDSLDAHHEHKAQFQAKAG